MAVERSVQEEHSEAAAVGEAYRLMEAAVAVGRQNRAAVVDRQSQTGEVDRQSQTGVVDRQSQTGEAVALHQIGCTTTTLINKKKIAAIYRPYFEAEPLGGGGRGIESDGGGGGGALPKIDATYAHH